MENEVWSSNVVTRVQFRDWKPNLRNWFWGTI